MTTDIYFSKNLKLAAHIGSQKLVWEKLENFEEFHTNFVKMFFLNSIVYKRRYIPVAVVINNILVTM